MRPDKNPHRKKPMRRPFKRKKRRQQKRPLFVERFTPMPDTEEIPRWARGILIGMLAGWTIGVLIGFFLLIFT